MEIDGQWYATVAVSPPLSALPLSFEEAAEKLKALPLFFLEPDGSFHWTSGESPLPWEVEGVLYDRNGALQYVEVKGACPAEPMRRLLTILSAGGTSLVIQLIRQAVFLTEDEFLASLSR